MNGLFNFKIFKAFLFKKGKNFLFDIKSVLIFQHNHKRISLLGRVFKSLNLTKLN